MMWLVVGVGLVLGAGFVLLLRSRTGQAEGLARPAADPAMHACPACGNSIAADWAFCPFCARALAQEEIADWQGERSLPAVGPGPS